MSVIESRSKSVEAPLATSIRLARERLDEHLCSIINWHFSPASGCPFWLDWAKQSGWDPRDEIQSFGDMLKFPHFADEALRDEPNERWIPKPYQGRPFFIFETGGTTGLPKQRISWEDHLLDYVEFSDGLDDRAFPRDGNWLMLGPTGPRRLRISIEHLAHLRGGSCYFVDLDPRWVKRLIAAGETDQANRYKHHVIEQGVQLIKHRRISCLFTTPKLLEALGERLSLPKFGIRGVFCGGTAMTPQNVRFLVEEVLENKAMLVPTYGNTLMGLARSRPLGPDDRYAITYHAPQPRAVLRIVDPENTSREVDYGKYGRVELTTLTRECFIPRFLERDEAIRRHPCAEFPWDGAGEVRPFEAMENKIVEGVY